jgi:hypothetical protein
MSRQSCRLPIQLHHSYYNIFPITVEPSSATNIDEAILYVLFAVLGSNKRGNTYAQIIDTTAEIFAAQYSRVDICAAFQSMLQTGILRTLAFVCRNWCEAPPEITYTWNETMDENIANQDLVVYLIQLAGGTRSYSWTFAQLFKPFVPPTLYQTTLAACGSW